MIVALERLSWLLQWQNRPEESVRNSQKMIELKPDLFNAYSTLGTTLAMQLRDYEQAEMYLKKGLQLNPHPSNWAYIAFVFIMIQKRQYEQAYAFGEQLMNADSMLIYLKASIAFNLMQGSMRSRKFQTAEKYIRWIEQTNIWVAQIAHAKANRGVIQFMAGNHAKAKRLLE